MTDGVGTADDPWTLTPSDHALVMSKRGETRLGFAILLSFFRDRGRFPREESEVDPQGIATLSRQLNVPAPVDGEAFLAGRTAERIRSEIRVRFGFREAPVADADALTEWLRDHVAAEAGGEIAAMVERAEAHCRELSIEPPSADRVERVARTALRAHEERFHDQMIKYTMALRLGTAETEAILRRFTKHNVQHPSYKAFAELGKAIKTIFLCQYLHSKELHREIHEGLNVVEQWNGATDFVFFARRGEMASNRREDHEISMLSLHLIQNCMVYVNTLMIQKLLAQPVRKIASEEMSDARRLFWNSAQSAIAEIFACVKTNDANI